MFTDSQAQFGVDPSERVVASKHRCEIRTKSGVCGISAVLPFSNESMVAMLRSKRFIICKFLDDLHQILREIVAAGLGFAFRS